MFRTKKLIGKKHKSKRIIRGGASQGAPQQLLQTESSQNSRMLEFRNRMMREEEQRQTRAAEASNQVRITGIRRCFDILCRSNRKMLVLTAIDFIDKIRENIRQDESDESNRTPQDNNLLNALLANVEATNHIIANLRQPVEANEGYTYESTTHDEDIGNLCTRIQSIFSDQYINFFPSDILQGFYVIALRLTPNIAGTLNNTGGKLYKKFKKTRKRNNKAGNRFLKRKVQMASMYNGAYRDVTNMILRDYAASRIQKSRRNMVEYARMYDEYTHNLESFYNNLLLLQSVLRRIHLDQEEITSARDNVLITIPDDTVAVFFREPDVYTKINLLRNILTNHFPPVDTGETRELINLITSITNLMYPKMSELTLMIPLIPQ
jgi:hypothetical protein